MAFFLKEINFISKKNFHNFYKSRGNLLRKLKFGFIKRLNRYLAFFSIKSKNFGGPKGTLQNFDEIDRYVAQKKKKGLDYFSWKFFDQDITIKNPEYTIGTPVTGAEVVSYKTKTTEHVYLMPNIKIYSKHFFSVTEDNYLLVPVSNYYSDDRRSHPAFSTLFFPKAKKLKGISIIIRGGAYWHKIQDGIPALYLAELAGFDLDKIDHFIIQDKQIDQNSIFTRVGIPLEKQRRLHDEKDAYECEQLLFSSWYDRKGNWYKDYLLKVIHPQKVNKSFPTKIYLSRSRVNTRKVLNEDKVILFLKRYGFECVHNEDLTTDEQINMFQNATHIISCHGSQLTNIVFCKPGTKICEIRHITHNIHYRKAFHDLSNGFNLDYFLLYTSEGEKFYDENNNVIETDTHMIVDLTDLSLMLKKMKLEENIA